MRAVLVCALLALSCTPTEGRCTLDSQCDALGQGHRACDLERGSCACVDDRGCGVDELCNSAGACQARSGCTNNDECGDEGVFCDITTGNCLSANGCGAGKSCCTLDSQCPFREICDVIAQICTAGCRDEADCVLGEGCIGGGFGRLGQCGNSCSSETTCGFGELCNVGAGLCQRDSRGPYCLGCAGGVQSDDCGSRGNFCLLDTVNGGAYCGVDCAADQACPAGYECRDVIILPASTLPTCALPEACEAERCTRSLTACVIDEDCAQGPPGSDCPRADIGNCALDPLIACENDAACAGAGECLKQECRQREGASFGVCTCTKDTDCPGDRCVGADLSVAKRPRSGSCELSGRDCFEDFECDVIACVLGGCLLGKNCKPANDRTCVDLLR